MASIPRGRGIGAKSKAEEADRPCLRGMAWHGPQGACPTRTAHAGQKIFMPQNFYTTYRAGTIFVLVAAQGQPCREGVCCSPAQRHASPASPPRSKMAPTRHTHATSDGRSRMSRPTSMHPKREARGASFQSSHFGTLRKTAHPWKRWRNNLPIPLANITGKPRLDESRADDNMARHGIPSTLDAVTDTPSCVIPCTRCIQPRSYPAHVDVLSLFSRGGGRDTI